MPQNKVDIRFTGDARDVISAAKKAENQVGKYADKVNRKSDSIKAFASRTVQGFKEIGAKLGGLGIGGLLGAAGLVAASRDVIDFNKQLAELTVQANISKDAAFKLKENIFELAEVANQRPEALLKGIAAIVERTGNIDFAVKALKDMGVVATASGARMEEIGATASNLQEKLGIKPTEILKAFDLLAAQGKKGAFTLQNMAGLFERLLSAASAFQVKGVAGLRGFGAFLQIAKRGLGTAEMTATAVERVISVLIEKRKDIFKMTKFDILDIEASKKAGQEVLKDFDFVLKEIVRRTDGSVFKLNQIFEQRAMRAIIPLAESFKKFGDFREFDNLKNVTADGAAVMEDFAKKASFSSESYRKMGIQMREIKELFLAKPIDDMAAALKRLSPILQNMGKLPFFDRSIWIAIASGIGALLLGVGATGAAGAALAVPAALLGLGSIAIPAGKKEVNRAVEIVKYLNPQINIPIPAHPGATKVGGTMTVPAPKIDLKMNVNISDKQVSVETKGPIGTSGVNVNRGSFAGVVP